MQRMTKLFAIIEDIELTHTDSNEVIINQDDDTIVTTPEFMNALCVKWIEWIKANKPELLNK